MIGSFHFVVMMGVAVCGVVGQVAPSGYEYVYVSFGETAPQSLTTTSAKLADGNQFGKNVAISEGLAAVSSSHVAFDASLQTFSSIGKVFLFFRDYLWKWNDSGQVFTSGKVGDGYGSSLALKDNLLVVGAPYDSSNGENQGMAYLYSGETFSYKWKFIPEGEAENHDFFGYSVAIAQGNNNYYGSHMVAVGAYGHSNNKEKQETGCVFIFAGDQSSGWAQVGIIEPSILENHAGFGYSLAAYENTIVVGSYGSDHVQVFEVLGHVHECPPGNHENPNDEDIPEECTYRRSLQEDQDKADRETKRFYTEWKYEEALMIGFDQHREEHKPEEKDSIRHFGASVAVYNNSGLVTVAVGCTQCVNDNDLTTGSVFIFSLLNKGHVKDGWYPDDYEPPKEGKRALQGEKDDKDNKHYLWDPMEHLTHASRQGEFWVSDGYFTGHSYQEQFGWSVSVDHSNVLIGCNPVNVDLGGRVDLLQRKTSNNIDNDFVVTGPLYMTNWVYSTDLQNSRGVAGDKFGYSVALYGGSVIVGTILSDFKDDGTYGTGAAYIYERLYLRKLPPSGNSRNSGSIKINNLGNPSTATGISFMSFSFIIGFFAVVALFYGVYRFSGGELSPRELMNNMIGVNEKSTRRDINTTNRSLRPFSAMDDSTSTVGSVDSRTDLTLSTPDGNSLAYTGLATGSSHHRPVSGGAGVAMGGYKPRQTYVPKGPSNRPSYTSSVSLPSTSGRSPSQVSVRNKELDEI